jgi:serine/threonine-protein kinase
VYGEIASGGMATIHLGRLLGPVGFSRTVAIKRLHAQYAKDPDFVAMFLDEARLAARIQNPNVVQTMDVVSEGDTLFLVMEYIQGEAFSKLWRVTTQEGAQIPLPIVSAIISGMLHGLHAVHEATDEHGAPLGIVHRDVSPQNVIVGVDGTPRVLDFGVAKAAGRLQTTRDGQLKGKLAYMGPEQLTGAPVARSSDVYSAAVVLWEAITGTRLYDGDNDARVFASVLAGNPPPPSHLVPELPEQLDAVVMRGLDRDPQKRFKTAREMALALEAVVRSASATEVGAWVERLAESSLAKRAAQVHELESNSAIKVPPVQPQKAANTNGLETPNTLPQSFEPIRLPMGSVTEAFEVGSDEDDAPTAYHPSVKIVNGEPVFGPPVESIDADPAPTPATDLGGTLPLTAAPYGRPVTGPVLVPDPAPSSSGAWGQYNAPPQSQAALSQPQPWVAQPPQQQYAGSNASISGSISRQMVAPAYDASQSIAYNPSASVQIVTVPTTSTAMKFLIAIATIALVFALFAVFMELRRSLSHGQDHAAASPSPVHSGALSTPTATNPFNSTDMNAPPAIMTGAPISQPFIPPGALTAAPDSNANAIAPTASANTAAPSASGAKKQRNAPPPPANKPQRIAPRQLPPGCVTPFTLDANGIKVPKPECM